MKKGFTSIELLFVLVTIGILTAVAIPKLVEVRGAAGVKTEKERPMFIKD